MAVMRTAKMSARLAQRRLPQSGTRRAFQLSAHQSAAQNFVMPALSPTMTEGNIAGWKMKEGESFSAGDVLLEIETDKATMDVEAQDDGILVKIMQQDGSKGVQVGERIAVTAEPGDDINGLEIPAHDSRDQATTASNSAAQTDAVSPSNPTPQNSAKSQIHEKSSERSAGSPHGLRHPLYPSVEHLLRRNGLSGQDAASIPATGPGGRLLKGDVMAYLGQIDKEYPATASARIDKLAHLDLTNIRISPPKDKSSSESGDASPRKLDAEVLAETEVAVPISLAAVVATQRRVQEALGIFLPLSTFIARASELANERLPQGKNTKPSADDLFNAVLGLDRVGRTTRGQFVPQISGISPMPLETKSKEARRNEDIIDILSKPTSHRSQLQRAGPADLGISAGDNVFSVKAQPGETERATQYLERLKLALEKDPGRLVI